MQCFRQNFQLTVPKDHGLKQKQQFTFWIFTPPYVSWMRLTEMSNCLKWHSSSRLLHVSNNDFGTALIWISAGLSVTSLTTRLQVLNWNSQKNSNQKQMCLSCMKKSTYNANVVFRIIGKQHMPLKNTWKRLESTPFCRGKVTVGEEDCNRGFSGPSRKCWRANSKKLMMMIVWWIRQFTSADVSRC